MRTKNEILDESLKAQSFKTILDHTISLHERLSIEVLIDIRDELTKMICILKNYDMVAYKSR